MNKHIHCCVYCGNVQGLCFLSSHQRTSQWVDIVYTVGTGRNMSVPVKMQLNKWVQWFASLEELTAVYAPCITSLYLKDVKSLSYVFQGDFQCEPERLMSLSCLIPTFAWFNVGKVVPNPRFWTSASALFWTILASVGRMVAKQAVRIVNIFFSCYCSPVK